LDEHRDLELIFEFARLFAGGQSELLQIPAKVSLLVAILA
jgi:hypothetical protein